MRRKSAKLTARSRLPRAVKNAGFGRLSATTEMLSSPGGTTGFFGRSRVSLSGRASTTALGVAGAFTTTGVFISIGVGLIDVTTVAAGEAACDRVVLSFVALTVGALNVGVVDAGTGTDARGLPEQVLSAQ